MDLALITAAVVIGGEFDLFIFLLYYPALALFAVVFMSLWLSRAWTTMVAVAYSAVSLTAGSGLDFDSGEEQALFARVVAMYAVVASVSLVARFERLKRQESAARERELHRERIELSQAIHDTTAQTAHMIGLGMHRAMKLAGESNEELTATLAPTSSLSNAAMWELRRPSTRRSHLRGEGAGPRALVAHRDVYEGHVVSQSGTEPPLAVETRARLFSIAHNALTNAFLHAHAGRVEVRLDFEADGIRLSVSDDGIGLPDDYAERGRGFGALIEPFEYNDSEGSIVVTCNDVAEGRAEEKFALFSGKLVREERARVDA